MKVCPAPAGLFLCGFVLKPGGRHICATLQVGFDSSVAYPLHLRRRALTRFDVFQALAIVPPRDNLQAARVARSRVGILICPAPAGGPAAA